MSKILIVLDPNPYFLHFDRIHFFSQDPNPKLWCQPVLWIVTLRITIRHLEKSGIKAKKNYLIKTYPVELGTSGKGRCCNNASEIEIKNINILFIIKKELKERVHQISIFRYKVSIRIPSKINFNIGLRIIIKIIIMDVWGRHKECFIYYRNIYWKSRNPPIQMNIWWTLPLRYFHILKHNNIL